MTAVRPEGRYQPDADPQGGAYQEGGPYQQQDPYRQSYPPGGGYQQGAQQGPYESGQYQQAPQQQGGGYGSYDQYGQYGQYQQGQPYPQGQQGQYQQYDPYQGQQLQGQQLQGQAQGQGYPAQHGAEDGWGVYEPAAAVAAPAPAEQTLLLHPAAPDGPSAETAVLAAAETVTMAAVAGTPEPPAPGGRAERRRAAQGRMAVRSGNGRRRAGGRAAADGRPRPKESVAVVGARFLGEFCITLGLVMLLFVSYQLWWTNVQADAAADGARSQLEEQFDAGPGPGATPAPGQPAPDPAKPETFEPGKGFAIIHLPKLGQKFPIAEGTAKGPVLDKGLVGHYTGTGMPADKAGNFALAAHRNTHGEPFRRINQLGKGDKIVVETATAYYTYEVTGGIPETPPSNVSVIKKVPDGSGYKEPGRYITLTTCTPEFSSKFRLIVFGKMIEERPRSQGKPAALTAG
ncbi:class E sortase [Kitasatospora sp. NPDC093806]|uniref:class E sortase n=1 Tax=Kitasatospora sp. NPDC093806 TaxID=3155075 RepID=UPI00343A9BAC